MSLKPAFNGKNLGRTDALYFDHHLNGAIRDGQWKLVRYGDSGRNAKLHPWQLYDMDNDRSEQNDLAKKYPDKIKSYRGKGSLFGIEFYSFLDNINTLVEKFPLKSVQNKSKLISKLNVATISSELYSKHNILSNVSESDNSDYLYLSPSIIVTKDDIDYFFSSLEEILNSKVDIKVLKYIFSSFMNLIK